MKKISPLKYRIEKLIEYLLMFSSTITSIVVFFIIIFLFKNGITIFNESPVEKGYTIIVNNKNTVSTLTMKQAKDIFNGDITNWKEVGFQDCEIITTNIDNLISNFSDEQLGNNYENLPHLIDSIINSDIGYIGYFPTEYITNKVKKININKISPADFFLSSEWYPTAKPVANFGTITLILSTLLISIISIIISIIFGISTSIYIAEIANNYTRNIIKICIELLAGIPSVVYGFFGLVVIVPLIRDIFDLPVGETALSGSIILAIMALPTIITISDDAIRNVPRTLKEASYALGASKLQTIFKVSIPYAKSGIIAAIMLGIGRVVGETMAVLMVTGNATNMPTSLLLPVRTITATIAAEMGEAPFGGTHFKALFALGIILFIITMLINFLVDYFRNKLSSFNK